MGLNQMGGKQIKSGVADGIGIDENGNLRVNTGPGTEIVNDAVVIKLDGTSLIVGPDGIKANTSFDNPVFTGVAKVGTGGYTALLLGKQNIPVMAGSSAIAQFTDETGAFSDWNFLVASNGWPVINLASSGGTLTTPTVSAAGNAYGEMNAWGYADTYRIAAKIVMEKDGTPSSTSLPSKIVFYTTPVDSLTPIARLTIDNAGNVTGITKAMIGLPNADNTSDINKPISTLTQTALNTKVNTPSIQTVTVDTTLTAINTITYVSTSSNNVTITLPDATTCGTIKLTVNRISEDNNLLTIVGISGQKINDQDSWNILYKGSSMDLGSDGTNWHIL